jgi:GT2 family glycosyltransferase
MGVKDVVDVVVVSHQSRNGLRACVEPLAAEIGVHVVVVDNASTDGSLEAVADLPVSTVALPVNGGFARGCNVGWRLASAPFVLFLNPDASIDPDSLDALVAVLEADSGVGAAGPLIVHSDGTLAFSQRRFPRLRSSFAQALFAHRALPRATWTDEVERDATLYERARSPEWVAGACIAVRRTALERIGGFDEGFFLYCEDADLCLRLRGAGYDVRFEPRARCVHEGGASRPRSTLLPVLAESRVRFAVKHRGRASAWAERAAIALGEVTHAIAGRGGRAARTGHVRSLRVVASPHPR